VKLPVQRPTALTFGGSDLGTLFVTTRAESGPDASQHAGGVFSTRIPGIKGIAAAYAFKL
jgi:sugar lactone lactonase YvrE